VIVSIPAFAARSGGLPSSPQPEAISAPARAGYRRNA
jgi:hypothetical protein